MVKHIEKNYWQIYYFFLLLWNTRNETKPKQLAFFESSLSPCVWSTLGRTGTRCLLQNWAPSEWPGLLEASWGAFQRRKTKLTAMYYTHFITPKTLRKLTFWNNKSLWLNTDKLITIQMFPSTYQGTDFPISKAELNLGHVIVFKILQSSWNLN